MSVDPPHEQTMRTGRDAALTLAPVGYLTMDCHGTIQDLNALAADMLGLHRHWLVGRSLLAYVADGSREAFTDHLERCGTEPGPVETEIWLTPADREPRFVKILSQPEPDLEASHTAFIDQTERYTAETTARSSQIELQKLNELLTHRNEQLRALTLQLTQAEQRERRNLAELLHDRIQGLLVGAWMQVDRLREADAEALSSGVDRILATLNDAIQTSRSLSRELSPRVVYDVGLAASLRWVAQRTQEELHVNVKVDADDQADVEHDDVRVILFQAVQELLLNVAKHAETSEAWLRSRLVGRDTVEVEVEDRGKGLDPEALQPHDSAGLGLFGTRERLTWLGGGMVVEAEPGEGTRVTLWVPRRTGLPEGEGRARWGAPSVEAQSEAPALESGGPETHEPKPPPGETGRTAEDPTTPQAASAQVDEAAGDAAGTKRADDADAPVRILIADDHAIVRDSIAHLVNLHPMCEVAGVASDGRKALELAREMGVDVVVMDVNMRGMDGIEATIQLKEQMPDVRVIGLTMLGNSAIEETMSAAGAEAVLNKSSATETLIHQICGRAPQA